MSEKMFKNLEKIIQIIEIYDIKYIDFQEKLKKIGLFYTTLLDENNHLKDIFVSFYGVCHKNNHHFGIAYYILKNDFNLMFFGRVNDRHEDYSILPSNLFFQDLKILEQKLQQLDEWLEGK